MRGQEDDSTKGWANMLEMEWLWAEQLELKEGKWLWAEQLESKEGIVDQEWEPMGCRGTTGRRPKCG